MIEAFSKSQWNWTPLLLVVCGALAAAAGVVGGGVFFLIALFLCTAGALVGIVGAVATFVTSRRVHYLPHAKPMT